MRKIIYIRKELATLNRKVFHLLGELKIIMWNLVSIVCAVNKTIIVFVKGFAARITVRCSLFPLQKSSRIPPSYCKHGVCFYQDNATFVKWRLN